MLHVHTCSVAIPTLQELNLETSGKNLPGEDWETRASALLSHEISFVMHESFRSLIPEEAWKEWQVVADEMAPSPPVPPLTRGGNSNAHYQRMCQTPLLSAELEQACFKRYNWLKFRANVYRSQIDLEHVSPEHILLIEELLEQATSIRNHITKANCRLAMSIVKKFSASQIEFDELLSEGLTTLMGAIEKFDFSRGFRFSTYATQSINRRLFRILSQRQKQRKRFLNNSEVALSDTLEAGESPEQVLGEEELLQIYTLLTHLEQRERQIIEARFGLHNSGRKQTFVEIGKRLKISKERVRQITERALLKLRACAERMDYKPV